MQIATHLIKIKGLIDINKWTEETLKEYVKTKLKEIDSSFHADLELFSLKDIDVDVWIYISALPWVEDEETIKSWLDSHIKEGGIKIQDFEIINLVDPKKNFFVCLQ